MSSNGTGSKSSQTETVMEDSEKNLTRRFIRPVERQRMRPWLIEHLDRNDIPGLAWQNEAERTFRISWKHAANQGFSMEKDTNLFERWAVHTGRHYDSDHKRWKANFRCALNSLPDVSEMKEMGVKKGSNAFKVYKFLNEKETKPVKAAFKKKKPTYAAIPYKTGKVKTKQESATQEEESEEEDSDGDHNYSELKLRLGHLQSGSAATVVSSAIPSLPLLEEFNLPSGVDLLLRAGSAQSRAGEPLAGTSGFASLRQILKAASESYASKQTVELKSEPDDEPLDETHEEETPTTCVYKCIWCERVCTTKVELFQHYLIDHQENLVAASETEPRKGDKSDPKLQKEIADLEKSVLGNYKPQTETVIEDGEVLDLSLNNELSNKDMYIEDKALDLTVKKAPVRARSEGLLDLSGHQVVGQKVLKGLKRKAKDAGVGKGKKGKGKKGKGQKGKVLMLKRGQKSKVQEDVDISFDDNDGDNDSEKDDDNDDDDKSDDDDDCGSSSDSHGDMSRQHSREDFLHAEMLLSLGSQGEGASREGSPVLGKKGSKRELQKRKIMSKESYKKVKVPKDAYMETLNKIIRKVDRRISQSNKVIVESLERDVTGDDGTALQKKWKEKLKAVAKMQEEKTASDALKVTVEEMESAKLHKEASQKLKEVRGIAKAISEAKKEITKCEDLPVESDLNESQCKVEDIKENAAEKLTETKFGRTEDEKPDLKSMFKASTISFPYRCVICGFKYYKNDSLLSHLKTHFHYPPFKCGICSATFEKSSFLLRNHLKTHMHDHKYACDKCGALFSVPLQLIHHLSHHEDPYKEKTTESPGSERGIIEDDSKPNKEDCGDIKSKKSGKNDNFSENTESKTDKSCYSEGLGLPKKKTYLSPFVCNLCDTSVSYGQELNTHVKQHYGEQAVESATKKGTKKRYVHTEYFDIFDILHENKLADKESAANTVEAEMLPNEAGEIEPIQYDKGKDETVDKDAVKLECSKRVENASILAKALQTAPRYGSNLVVDKATGLIYHITNIPESVKDYQALSLTGQTKNGENAEKTEEHTQIINGEKTKDNEVKEIKAKDSNESLTESHLVHVPMANSSVSFPILIRKPISSTWTLAQSKSETSNAAEVKSPSEFMTLNESVANQIIAATTSLGVHVDDLSSDFRLTLSKQNIKFGQSEDTTPVASVSLEAQSCSDPGINASSESMQPVISQNSARKPQKADSIKTNLETPQSSIHVAPQNILSNSALGLQPQIQQELSPPSITLTLSASLPTEEPRLCQPSQGKFSLSVQENSSKLLQDLAAKSIVNLAQPTSPVLQAIKEGPSALLSSSGKPAYVTVSQTGGISYLTSTSAGAAVYPTGSAYSTQGIVQQNLCPGITISDKSFASVINGNINIPCILQAVNITQTSAHPGTVTTALNSVPNLKTNSSNSSDTGLSDNGLILLPSVSSASDPNRSKSQAMGFESKDSETKTDTQTSGTHPTVKPGMEGLWVSEILAGVTVPDKQLKFPRPAVVSSSFIRNTQPRTLPAVTPVLGNTSVLLTGQNVVGLAASTVKQKPSKCGIVQVKPQSISPTLGSQVLLPLNTLGLQAGNQTQKTPSCSPSTVLLSLDSLKQAVRSKTTPVPPVLLNMAVGENGAKSAAILSGNVQGKQTSQTTTAVSTQNILLGPFMQKLPASSSQVIPNQVNLLSTVAQNPTKSIANILSHSVQTQVPTQPQFLVKVPGIGDLLYRPPPTQQVAPSMPATKQDSSDLDISQLIQNSLKTAQAVTASSANVTLSSSLSSAITQSQTGPMKGFSIAPGITPARASGISHTATSTASNLTVTMTNAFTLTSTVSSVGGVPVGGYSVVPISRTPAMQLSTQPAVAAPASSSPNTLLYSLQPSGQIVSSTNRSPQLAIATSAIPTQFSVPLCVKTSTGGGIATIQIGDKAYPLSLVFYPPQGSTQAVTTATVSIATTSVKAPVSTVSVLSTSSAAKVATTPVYAGIAETPADSSADHKPDLSALSMIAVSDSTFTSKVSTAISSSDASALGCDLAVKVSDSLSVKQDVRIDEVSPSLDAKTPPIPKLVITPFPDGTIRFSSNDDTSPVISTTVSRDSLPTETKQPLSVTISATADTSSSEDTSKSDQLVSTSSIRDDLVDSSDITPSLPDLRALMSNQSVEQDCGLWLCHECSLFFPSSEKLAEHCHSKKKNALLLCKCEHCEAVFYNVNQMRQHNLTHFLKVKRDLDSFVCPRCDIVFSHSDQLKLHCVWTHKDDTFACPHCEQIYLQEVALQAHAFHHPFICNICKSRFDTHRSVLYHVMLHDSGPNCCTFCKQMFKTTAELKEHLAICQDMQLSTRFLWFCENCKLPLSSRKKLEEHLQTHYSRTLFFCGLCKLAFLDTATAKAHMENHKVLQITTLQLEECSNKSSADTSQEDERRIKKEDLKHEVVGDRMSDPDSSGINDIKIADLGATSKSNYKEYFNAGKNVAVSVKTEELDEQGTREHEVGTGPEKFKCSECTKCFPSCFKLKQHKVLAHLCPRTNRNVSFYQHAIENIKKPRSYVCKICSKSFQLQSTLLWHMKQHYDGKFSCRLCSKDFRTRSALKVHGRKFHTFHDHADSQIEINTDMKITEMQAHEMSMDTEMVNSEEQIDTGIDFENSDESDHSEEGLKIDEDTQENSATPGEADTSVESRKVKLPSECLIGKEQDEISKEKTERSKQKKGAVKAKKEQKKKVFGCGLCNKSYFKLMKLTKHVWEHEELQTQCQKESQSPDAMATTGKEAVALVTDESDNKNETLQEVKNELDPDEPQSVGIEEVKKTEGKYMCALCKIKFSESAELYKHAKIHLGLADIVALAKRKHRNAPMVTGDPSQPKAVYIELDSEGNLVRRIPPAASSVKEEGKGGTSEGEEGAAIVVCNICKKTVYSGPNDKSLDQLEFGNHKCDVKTETLDTDT